MLKDGGQHYEDLTRFTVFCTDHEDFIFDANLERVRCQTGKDAPEDREQGSVSLQRYRCFFMACFLYRRLWLGQ